MRARAHAGEAGSLRRCACGAPLAAGALPVGVFLPVQFTSPGTTEVGKRLAPCPPEGVEPHSPL